jgi:cytochrome P450
VFEDPERFDLTRGDNPHLGFGFCIHHCLGGPLSRMEARVAVPALVRRARRIELVTDHPAYKDNLVLRGLAELPAVLEPA